MTARGTLVARPKATLCPQLWLETTGSSPGPPAVGSTSAVSSGRPHGLVQVHKHFQRCQSGRCLSLPDWHGWFAVFTRTAQASCLVDEPKQIGQYKYPEQLPGQLYNADTQCKWQFGSKAKLCSLDFVKVRSFFLKYGTTCIGRWMRLTSNFSASRTGFRGSQLIVILNWYFALFSLVKEAVALFCVGLVGSNRSGRSKKSDWTMRFGWTFEDLGRKACTKASF